MTKIEFFQLFVPLAQKVFDTYGVPKELFLAQTAIESQWGKKPIGNNFWGIKQAQRHKDAKTVLTTEQQRTGETYKARLAFANYPSIEAGALDYGWLISNGAPYKTAWNKYQQSKNLVELAADVAKVYATGLGYSQLLRTLVQQQDIVSAARDAA